MFAIIITNSGSVEDGIKLGKIEDTFKKTGARGSRIPAHGRKKDMTMSTLYPNQTHHQPLQYTVQFTALPTKTAPKASLAA